MNYTSENRLAVFVISNSTTNLPTLDQTIRTVFKDLYIENTLKLDIVFDADSCLSATVLHIKKFTHMNCLSEYLW